tara:strand:- start:363 stop:812 length:450 start_codon:yes stop_codon:yes gene_type:complete
MKPIILLDWYYNMSAAELGLSAQSFSDSSPSSERDYHPDAKAIRAARKQGDVRAALHQLSPQLQRVIEAAYNPGPLATQLRLKYGLLAGILARNWPPEDASSLENLVGVSKRLLITAHKAFSIAYKPSINKSVWLTNLEKSVDPYSSHS